MAMATRFKEGGGLTAFVVPLLALACLLWVSEAQIDTTAREPPRITEPVVSRQIFKRKGMNVTLQCKATGKPDPTIKWFWNEAEVTAATPGMTYDGVRGTLVIRNLDMGQEGFYQCRAENVFPSGKMALVISADIEVRVARLGSWTPSDVIETEELHEGKYGFLRCDDDLPVTYGHTSFKWMRVTADNQDPLPINRRLFIDNEGTLHFTSVGLDDELTNNALYACALSNNDDGNIQRGQRKRVVVIPKDPDEIVDDKPLLRIPSESTPVTFKRNQTGQLECFFSGPAVPSITWEKNGEPISAGGRYAIQEFGRVLEINNVEQADETNYQCYGTLSNGQRAEGRIGVNVTSAPIWKDRLQSLTIPEGQNATFNCDAHSAYGENPPDAPLWYQNGALFKSFPKEKYDFQLNGKRMIVVKVQKDYDIACFRCKVRNSVGTSVSDACLNVILPITIIAKPEEEQTVKKGGMVNLTTMATTDSLVSLSYRWTFKDQTYQVPNLPPYVEYDDETKQTFINTANFTDDQMEEIAGLYTLEVYHRYEKKFVTVEVTVEDEGPVVVPVSEAGFDYWIIGLIIGILLIIIVILIICCVICRRKMQEGDYPLNRKETAAGLDPEKELKDSGFHDLSRADYDYLPEKKSPNMDFDENIPLGDDESFGSAEYGEEATAFNEDGSFIGVYSKDKKGPPPYNPAESNV